MGCFKTLLCHPNAFVKFAWLLALFLEKKVKCQVILCKILRVSLLGWMRHGSLLGHLQRYFVIKPGSAKWITFFLQNWVVVWNIFYFHPYSGKWSNLTRISFRWVGSTTNSKIGLLESEPLPGIFPGALLVVEWYHSKFPLRWKWRGQPKGGMAHAMKNRLRLFPFPLLMVMAVGASGWCNFFSATWVKHGDRYIEE